MTTNRVHHANTPLSPLSTQSPSLKGTAEAAQVEEAKALFGAKTPAKKAAATNYDVNISTTGKERAEAFNKALDIARKTPDVRADRVADLKQRIAQGKYHIDSGKIADGMLREAVKDHLAESER